ncbi:adenylate/guanylate cyclase domain-containing protein [Thiohalomonas denitrificans]|uniref:adenylate/guanylate cyclase domain-containing protein n=1 Tax=Thiohalomonas denitrificans TaxID=415747 RepID=UPI0026EF39A6|nr:adenylate/guanylate cyclase domain-containing protein [Thiohalomonas denitrificans]
MHWRESLSTIANNLSRNGHGLLGRCAVFYRDQRDVCGTAVYNRLPDRVPIAYKLALAFTLLVASGMTLLGLLVGSNQTRLLEQQIQTFGNTLVGQVADSIEEPLLAGDTLTLQLAANNLIKDKTVLGVGIYSDEGLRITYTGIVPLSNRLEAAGIGLTTGDEQRIDWSIPGKKSPQALTAFVAPVRYRDVTAGYALLAFDRSLLERAKTDTITAVSATTLLIVLLGVGTSFYLGGRLTRPIHQLINASRAISEGKYDFRFTGRRNDEIGVLMDAMNSMGEGLLRKEQVEKVFSRYVSPNVAKQVLSELENVEQVQLGGRHVEASVLFADIVGFTSMSEKMTPKEVSHLLNTYFTQIARAVDFCGGHIDKYMGDCAMIVFGVPVHHEDHAFRATACASMIIALTDDLNRRREQKGLPAIHFRVGINSGRMLAGNMGSADRMDYTVVGDAVNMASRLSHAGEPGEIIITGEMVAMQGVAGRILAEKKSTISLRGKEHPVAILRVTGINDPFREEMLAENRRILEALASEAA